MLHADPIIRQIHACVLADVPVALGGPPGGGKTARVKAYAGMRDLALERTLLSRCETIDLKTRAVVDGTIKVFAMPEITRLADAFTHDGRRGILFLDEFNRSSHEVEGAALDIIDSPPVGVSVIIACNPPSRGQAARSLESAAANRFCHLAVPTDAHAYAAALLAGWPVDGAGLPALHAATYATHQGAVRAIASGFIRHRGDEVLLKEPTDPVAAGRAWPSPRTWDMALRLYAACRTLGYEAEDTVTLIAGCVGPGVGVEFLAYAADSEVDPEELLKAPSAWEPPLGRVDKSIAAFGMVLAAVTRTLTEARWGAAWALVGRASDAGQADAAIFAANSLIALERANGTGAKVKLSSSLTMMQRHASRIAKLLHAARTAGGGGGR